MYDIRITTFSIEELQLFLLQPIEPSDNLSMGQPLRPESFRRSLVSLRWIRSDAIDWVVDDGMLIVNAIDYDDDYVDDDVVDGCWCCWSASDYD